MGYDTQSLGLEAYKYWTNAAYRQRAGAGVGVSAAPDAPAASAVKATTEATRADVLDTESVLFEDAPLASEGTRSDLCVCVCVLRVYPLSVMLLLLRARVDETQPWVVATVSRTEELQTRSYGGTRETRHVRALVAMRITHSRERPSRFQRERARAGLGLTVDRAGSPANTGLQTGTHKPSESSFSQTWSPRAFFESTWDQALGLG